MSVAAWRPSSHYEQFLVCRDGDGGFFITVIAGDGGYSFAAGFQNQEEAEWTASLLNAAIGARPTHTTAI